MNIYQAQFAAAGGFTDTQNPFASSALTEREGHAGGQFLSDVIRKSNVGEQYE